MTLFETEHDWTELLEPKVLGGDLKFPVLPQTIIEHARRRSEEENENYILRKEQEEDGVRYRVMKNLEHPDDGSQEEWDLDYGAEFRIDGSVRLFANYIPVSHSNRRGAAREASKNQFKSFKERSDYFWSEKYGR